MVETRKVNGFEGKGSGMAHRQLAAMLVIGVLTGCGAEDSGTPKKKKDSGHAGHSHAHPEAGPNGGQLIELGSNEEYHGEWTYDDGSGKVTIYVLNGEATEVHAIAAEKVSVSVIYKDKKKGDVSRQFEFEAVNRTGDPPKTAQFESISKELGGLLTQIGHGVEARLTAKIGEKEFVGEFQHDSKHPKH